MTVSELLRLIPPETFRELAVETKVDAQVKKLSGEVMFKLILFSMLNSERLSLRVMETFLQSARFKSFSHYDILDSRYNSIRDRICSINAEYFEKLFEKVFSIYNRQLKEEHALSKTDSTYVALAAKLFSEGIKNGVDQSKRFVKYSVNLKGSLPSMIKIFTDQSHVNESVALSELINDCNCLKDNIVVFDRGLRSRRAFDRFTDDYKYFVSRGDVNVRCKAVASTKVPKRPEGSSLKIFRDETGWLISKKEKKTQHHYRLIKGTLDSSGETISFITNMLDEDCYLIAHWYRQRWEIESFFKFIKQHLNFKHLVSRDENGIKVMLYMTMITATLILAYKKINSLKGYKITKLKFEIELENEVIKAIVTLCGGNPAKAPHFFSSA
jgi:hypothetical protein